MWRFVQVSDPHLGSQVDGIWNNNFICTMMPDVISCLRRDLAELNPDFILLTGDIASQQTRDAMFAARDLCDSLGFPYYPMGGNHDFCLRQSRDWFRDAFMEHLPNGETFYSYDHKNLHFCVLDPWWKLSDGKLREYLTEGPDIKMGDMTIGVTWAVPDSQLEWLEKDLSENKDKPAILAVHYPAIPLPKRMLRPGVNDAGYLENGNALIDVLKAHPKTTAIMSGHVHMHYIEEVDDITQITTGALPEFPVEYRDVHVYKDRLEVYTRGLSNKSFAKRSLIEGKEWTSGEPGDRKKVIPLL